MKKDLSKTKAKETVDSFFSKEDFSSKDVKKVKRLAMKYKITLGVQRKNFCKKCLSKLKGKTKITNNSKSIVCSSCGYKNKFAVN